MGEISKQELDSVLGEFNALIAEVNVASIEADEALDDLRRVLQEHDKTHLLLRGAFVTLDIEGQSEVPQISTRIIRTRKEYKDYLRSPEWRSRRKLALERAGHRCQLCNGGKNLHVHHRTYERLGHEDPNDLTVLCSACHAMFHDTGARELERDNVRMMVAITRLEEALTEIALCGGHPMQTGIAADALAWLDGWANSKDPAHVWG